MILYGSNMNIRNSVKIKNYKYTNENSFFLKKMVVLKRTVLF